MTDVKVYGQDLLREWYLYKGARPKDHVLDIQHDKDELERWAKLLQTNLLWEGDLRVIGECCCQFETRLSSFKDKIVIELLTGGAA